MMTKKEKKKILEEDTSKIIMKLAKPETFPLIDYWYGNWCIFRPLWK